MSSGYYCYCNQYTNGKLCLNCRDRRRSQMFKKQSEDSKLREKILMFGKENNIVTKCISDQIFLYIRYVIAESMKQYLSKEQRELLNDITIEFYREYIRGNTEYEGKNTKVVACTLVYIGCVLLKYADNGNNGRTLVTAKDVCEMLNVTEVGIRNLGNIIRNKAKLGKKYKPLTQLEIKYPGFYEK